MLLSTRQAPAPSPATLRLQLASADAQLQVTLLKRRGRPLLDPITLQLRPAHWEQCRVEADTALPRTVPAATVLLDTPRPLDELLA